MLLNYRRKSTKGWQIWNILLDFSGGILSIIQLIGDSIEEAKEQGSLYSSWTTGIVGNPAKIGLGVVSISFDVSFDMHPHFSSCTGMLNTPCLLDHFHNPALRFVSAIIVRGKQATTT